MSESSLKRRTNLRSLKPKSKSFHDRQTPVSELEPRRMADHCFSGCRPGLVVGCGTRSHPPLLPSWTATRPDKSQPLAGYDSLPVAFKTSVHRGEPGYGSTDGIPAWDCVAFRHWDCRYTKINGMRSGSYHCHSMHYSKPRLSFFKSAAEVGSVR